MKDKLTKALQLQTELDKILNELFVLLKVRHRSDYITNIEIQEKRVSYRTNNGSYDSIDSVSWDYFDNPQEYIRREDARLNAEIELQNKLKAAQESKKELEMYLKLKEKYDK